MQKQFRIILLTLAISFITCLMSMFYPQKFRSSIPILGKAAIQDLQLHFPGSENMTYRAYQFDVQRSNSLSLDRPIPDTRPLGCPSYIISDTADVQNLPKASIIIPFYNEAWSVLLRCVKSVLNRSPDALLEEILLVDDGSEVQFLKEPLDDYLNSLEDSRVKLIRRPIRGGLIISRITGAEAAKGDVIVFLDAHNEVNVHWLEPLLEAITKDKSLIAIPVIDYIDEQMNYIPWGEEKQGGFTWHMDFQWKKVSQITAVNENQNETDSFPTATTIGCAMAMDRHFFFKLGAFDPSLHIWGGENLEISFKSWMCGGSMYVYPCSRVGHLFRKFLPYTLPSQYGIKGTIQSNLQRVAEVWMDDYTKFYFATINRLISPKGSDSQILQQRKALRMELNCKSFEWYLKNVLPEMPVPKGNPNYYGQLMNLQFNECLSQYQTTFTLGGCNSYSLLNTFSLTPNSRIVLQNDNCMEYNITGNQSLGEYSCLSAKGAWSFDTSSVELIKTLFDIKTDSKRKLGQLLYSNSRKVLCLSSLKLKGVGLFPCRERDPKQYWYFTYSFDYKTQKALDKYTYHSGL